MPPDENKTTMRWLLYDDGVDGHHVPYMRAIDEEVCRRGPGPIIASPVPPAGDVDRRWIELKPQEHRNLRAKRRQMRRVVREGLSLGADTLVDLFFDKSAWAVASARPFARRVHVLHHIDQLSPTARSGIAIPRAWLLRQFVRLLSGDSSIVVHTPGAADRMSELFGRQRVFLGRYPVAPPTPLPRGPERDDVITLAFAGVVRDEKGLETLAGAVQRLSGEVEVRVLGPQSPGTRERYAPLFGKVPVEWHDDLLSIDELRRALNRASLTVLPYRERFGLYGGSSATLLDALAAGAPVVVSPALSDQVPAGYGAVVAGSNEDPEALAAAIESAVSDLAQLRATAARLGPTFIAEAHSPRAYVDVLERAAASSGVA